MRSIRSQSTRLVLAVLVVWPSTFALAQERPIPDRASLVLDGVVREVFRSERRTGTDVIVELTVTRAELGPGRDVAKRVTVPAPGEAAYVHVQVPRDAAPGRVPPERTRVRVYLDPRPRGGWQGSGPDWFEVASRDLVAAASDDPEPTDGAMASTAPVPAPANNASALMRLGIDATILKAGAGDRIGIQITRVEPDRPGARAGLEVGDLIIGIGESSITSMDQFSEIVRRDGPDLTIIVFDKNTKKAVPVPVRLDAMAASAPAPAPTTAPVNPAPAPATAISSRLGLNAEVLSASGRAAIKVIEVKPASPAGMAGIEVGDVIIGVGKQAITNIEGFNREVEAARGSITLVIRDVNTGRSVPVEVKLDGAMAAPAPAPAPSTTTPGFNPGGAAPVGGLGVSVEPADDKGIPTIRVSQVASGSAAERAGLKRGDIVESVNDTIIFDPDHFNEVVAKAGRSIKMVVKDARTGRKGPIQIDLGGR